MEMTSSNMCVAGIDLTENEIMAHVLPNDQNFAVLSNPDGLKDFFQKIVALKPAVAVMEAVEGDKLSIAIALAQSGVPVVAIQSRQLNQFAEIVKFEKKITRLDAYVMARFAMEIHKGQIQNIDGFTPQDLVGRARELAKAARPQRDPLCEKIISDKFGFIWVGIPKVATRSILTALYREPVVDVAGRLVNEELQALLDHDPNYRNYFKFALVRNSWARIVSCYVNKIQRANEETQRHIIDRYSGLRLKMPFEEFIRFLLEDPSGQDEGANRHWLSQHAFVSDSNGQLLVDFIGKIENLADDFAIACKRIGLPDIQLPWLNSREGWKVDKKLMKQKDPFYYRQYFTPETQELVRTRYRRDIELFGYDF